jgi:competence protein ComEA
VELNSASADQLCTLPGIGPKKAEAIIAFREKQPFTRVTQLLRVRGIGMRTLERLRPHIYVGPPARPASSAPAEVPDVERTSPLATAPPAP